jgi:Ca-activated chloride channel family protein
MTFIWGNMLWLLLIIPALVVIYVLLQWRKKEYALRYANLSIVKQAMGKNRSYKRHIPPAVFLVGLALMIVAMARPSITLTLGVKTATVILAMDVSRSMVATDVEPTRIAAAKEAAKTFVMEQPKNIKIGIVTFAGTAFLVQAPTLVRDDLIKAINGFELQRGTAVGSGLLLSLATLFPNQEINVTPDTDPDVVGGFKTAGQSETPVVTKTTDTGGAKLPESAPVPAGSYPSGIVILLTDGATNAGPDPITVAQQVANHGVRVYTVGFGTKNNAGAGLDGPMVGHSEIDEDALQKVADATKGEYFRATTGTDLKAIYKKLNTKSITETTDTEISAVFAALAAIFTLLAGGLSMLWSHRLI